MTFELLEEVKLFVSGNRHKAKSAAYIARLNGYNQIALDHENQVVLADKILKGLAEEKATGVLDVHKTYD